MGRLRSSAIRVLLLLSTALGLAAQSTLAPAPAAAPEFPSGWYLGGGLGSVKVKIPDRNMELEGIQFTNINASADNAGFKVFGGYWITPHFGFEMGLASLGSADATFSYSLPPSETGTGTTKVQINSTSLAFQVGQVLGPTVLFLKGGVQFWSLSYETRFRLSTGESQARTLDKSGNSGYFGLGLEWAFKQPWSLRLEGETVKMDITDATMITAGLSYSFR
jgi:hypothetical protein